MPEIPIKGKIKRLMQKKLFGTDGIRGRANHFPVTPSIALKVGQALGLLLRQKYKSQKHTVLIGKDTRLSGYMLEQALAGGLNSMGVWVQLTGPLPTPGIGFLAQNMRVSAGVVISASHNPYYDNGIKIFLADGFKISSEEEKQIEEWVFSEDLDSKVARDPGRTRRIVDATGRYIVFAKRSFPENKNLKGIRLVLDCANGAAYKAAPAIFEELGAKVIAIGNKPDGFNINKESGALFPEKIAEQVLKHKADAGISLDGDGDRVILSDEKGRILNGDHILGICAMHLKEKEKLPGYQIVTTHLSNTGLEVSLKPKGISIVRTEVGDRHVVETMRKHGIVLGGEPSGHIVFLNHTTTGDACVAALNVMGAFVTQNKKLSELRDAIHKEPQVSLSVPIARQTDLESLEGYREVVSGVQSRLGENAKVHIRFSGTESLLRILVEGRGEIEEEAHRLKDFLSKRLS